MKGLVTEAGPLTYPENASIDEDNCVIYRQGNRSRRLGIDYQQNSVLSSYSFLDQTVGAITYHTFEWEAVNKIADLYFLVVQFGTALKFYNMAYEPLSSGLMPFSFDMTPYIVSGFTNHEASVCEVDMAAGGGGFGDGALFVVGSLFEPFFITYDPVSNTVSGTKITIQIRDFVGLDDGLANDEEVTTLSPAHEYNLMNQGWVDATQQNTGPIVTSYGNITGPILYPGSGLGSDTTSPIYQYNSVIGRYPSNSKQWWLGQVAVAGPDGLPGNITYAVGQFDPQLLNTFYIGTGRAPRGHYILNAFNQDRAVVSGITGLPVAPGNGITNHRPVSVTFFSGRVWYVCDGTVYYSQVLDDNRKAGFCFQDADPTSQTLSELVATDGGYIPIPEMAAGVKLWPFGSGVMVFATNGIWFVSGGSGGYSGTDVAVTKIASIGTTSPNSVVEDGHYQLFVWGTNGIWKISHRISSFGALNPTAIGGAFDKELISETTIQTLYNAISAPARVGCHSVYDPATNCIQWLYNYHDSATPGFCATVLNLDLTLSSFYPWSISSIDNGTTPWVCGIYKNVNLNANLVDGTTYVPEPRLTYINYLTAVPQPTGSWSIVVSAFNQPNFSDWFTYDAIGQLFLSFMETGYELLEDAERNKEIGYVFVYLKQTESGWVSNGSGDWVPQHPSSCLFQVKWDWASSSTSNKWSAKVEAYRPYRFVPPDTSQVQPNGALVFDSGYPLVVSKNRVRGHGKSIQFRFECDKIGYDFDLKGWAVNYTGGVAP